MGSRSRHQDDMTHDDRWRHTTCITLSWSRLSSSCKHEANSISTSHTFGGVTVTCFQSPDQSLTLRALPSSCMYLCKNKAAHRSESKGERKSIYDINTIWHQYSSECIHCMCERAPPYFFSRLCKTGAIVLQFALRATRSLFKKSQGKRVYVYALLAW